MKDLLDKLSSYNIFNYLLPGILFTVILKTITKYDLAQENIIIGSFIYYFIGLVVSCIGSLVIEPILRKIKFIKFSEYSDFITASNKDPKLETLSEVNNMYRTICSVFGLTLVAKLYEWLCLRIEFLNNNNSYLLILFLLGLFLLSYRKQTDFVRKRVENNK